MHRLSYVITPAKHAIAPYRTKLQVRRRRIEELDFGLANPFVCMEMSLQINFNIEKLGELSIPV